MLGINNRSLVYVTKPYYYIEELFSETIST